MHSESQSSVNWIRGEQYPSARGKHVDLQLHFIKYLKDNETLRFPYISAGQNDSGLFTNSLDKTLHLADCKRIGLRVTDREKC